MIDSRILCTGQNDAVAFVEGWYGLQRSPEGLLFRSSAAKARLKLLDIGGPVRLILLLSARPEHTRKPLKGRVTSGTHSSFPFELTTNQWTTREGVLEVGEDSIVTIEVDNPWSPDRLYKNGDARSLGIMLSAIRISPLYAPVSSSNNLWVNLSEAMK